MIQIDMCHTCPQCGNGSLADTDVYKYFGLKYTHTEYKCLRHECDFTTTGTRGLYFVYNESYSKAIKRDKKLNQIL